jgi:hypothetical protein
MHFIFSRQCKYIVFVKKPKKQLTYRLKRTEISVVLIVIMMSSEISATCTVAAIFTTINMSR